MFSMRVMVYDPYAMEERILSVGGKSASLDTTLEEANVVSINVPLTEETEHMIARDELGKMKESAILVNTSRGKVIDQEVLIWALEEGEIGNDTLLLICKSPQPKEIS